MISNKPAIHVLEIPQNFHPCLRQAPVEFCTADLHQLRCLILFSIFIVLSLGVFFAPVIKLLLARRDHIPFRSSLYILQIGNHHLGADKFQHYWLIKRGAGEGSRFILSK